MGNVSNCNKYNEQIYTFLRKKLESNTQVSFGEICLEIYSFEIYIPKKVTYKKSRHCYDDFITIQKVEFDGIEIAVFSNVEDKVLYSSTITYGIYLLFENVVICASHVGHYPLRKFFSEEHVLVEIERLVNL
jgi:hypothetical protein